MKYWKNPEGSEYDLGIELYFSNADEKFFPALQMQLSKTDEQLGKGEFKFFPNFDEPGQGLESIVTRFAATTDKKTLDVRVYFAAAADGPSSLGLNVTDKDGIITGAGTAIRPEQDGIEGPIAPFQKNAEYAFVCTLAADSKSNIAVEKFAAVLDLLRTDASGFDCSAYGSFIDASLPSDICRTNSAVTDTQVLNGLKPSARIILTMISVRLPARSVSGPIPFIWISRVMSAMKSTTSRPILNTRRWLRLSMP